MLVLSLSFTVGGHGQCERRGRLLNVTGSSKSTVYFNTESSLSGEKKKNKPNQTKNTSKQTNTQQQQEWQQKTTTTNCAMSVQQSKDV